ncbi:hypothetical protein IFM89_009506 [Coptis chinensis]|uniref:Uncharacterized protein n=1 Tax=Coptis chinensis TaxID=261450 RepID=A0A835H7B8_9MAGN|nr:hypothetical protein IFM89_009506 [Coptis chinensis]
MGSRIQDKTIAFIGDSLGRPHFQSLIVRMVMVTGGEEIPDVHNIKSNYGMASSKLVVLFIDILMVGLIGSRAARRTFFITRRLLVEVSNTAVRHHCNSGKLAGNRWVMYVDGRPNTDKKMVEMVQKFSIGIGNLEHLGTCDNSTPLAGGSEVLQDDSNDPITENTILLRYWILLLYLS